MRIFIVEDSAVDSLGLRNILGPGGHDPMIFTSGASETVHRAAAFRPDGYVLKPDTEPSRGLAVYVSAERLLTAMDEEAEQSWRVGGRIHRELRAVLNCVSESPSLEEARPPRA